MSVRPCWMLVGTLLLGGGCDSCDGCHCGGLGGVLEDATRRPDDAIAKRIVSEELKTEDYVATAICGFPAKGIAVTKITVSQSKVDLPGFGSAELEGTALHPGPKIHPEVAKRPCIGTVTWALHLKTKDGKEEWTLYVLRVSEVKTPGVKWTPPPPSGDDD